MEAISFALNDLYFVIHPFKFSCVNGVITVVDDTVAVSFECLGKCSYRWMI